jgi:hypothetical protein
LLLPLMPSGDVDAALEFGVHAFVAPTHPQVTVTIAAA